MGRAARHLEGEVVMYADNITKSMQRAIDEVARRRKIQEVYNIEHGLTPTKIERPFREKLIDEVIIDEIDFAQLPPDKLKSEIKKLTEMMKYEAEMLNFERAAVFRDKLRDLKENP